MTMPEGTIRGRVSREELRSAYRDADFLIFPSRLEGFGYVAAESMACGTPVICAPEGAVAEIVNPPECGIAIGGDLQAFASNLASLWHKPERIEIMGTAAAIKAQKLLSEDVWIAKMERALLHTVNSQAIVWES